MGEEHVSFDFGTENESDLDSISDLSFQFTPFPQPKEKKDNKEKTTKSSKFLSLPQISQLVEKGACKCSKNCSNKFNEINKQIEILKIRADYHQILTEKSRYEHVVLFLSF